MRHVGNKVHAPVIIICDFITGTADMNDMFEGDIILTPEQKREMELDRRHVHERAVVRSSGRRWPNGVVPYVVSSSLCEYNNPFCYMY